jgi:tRNA modification GTPase
LESARLEVQHGPDRAELAAEELRAAVRALESLVGRVDVEDILDEIFASFCLGK